MGAIQADSGLSASTEKAAGTRAWLAVAVLLLIYIFSFIDRQILTLLVKPIQQDFGIGDFQMGLLLGPAFGLFYVACGLFMGQLVDRSSRRAAIGLGMSVWGLATAFGGIARSYAALFVSRLGVGVGESVLTPAAHAIIAESFPPRRLSIALAVYSSGVVIGSSLAIAIGGAVIQWVGDGDLTVPVIGLIKPWNLVLLVVGVATLMIIPVVALLPKSGPAKPLRHVDAPADIGLLDLVRSNWRIFLLIPFGFGCTNIVVSATFAWIPAMFDRSFGWSAGDIGLALAIQHLVCGLAGQLGMAMLADWLYARGMADAHTRIQVISLSLTIPLLAIGLLSNSAWGVLLLGAPFIMFSFPFLGFANAALQLQTPSGLRGRVSAMFLAIVTATGTLLGAPLVGLMTGALALGDQPLGTAMAIVSVAAGALSAASLFIAGRALRDAHAAKAMNA